MKQNLSRWAEGSAYNIINEISIGFQKSQMLFTAVEFDIFSQIHNGNNSSEKIANAINVNQKYLERLLDGLVAIKLLTKNEMYYNNTNLSEKHLVKDSPNYYGFVAHNAALWHSWGTLTDVVKTGKIVADVPIHSKDEQFIKNYLLSYDWKSKIELEIVMPYLKLLSTKRFLKLGAVSYRYALEIAKSNPDAEVSIVDYPNVINVLQELLNDEENASNINLLKSENFSVELEYSFDTILVDSIIEDYSIWDNINAFTNLYSMLTKGGKVIIHKLLANDNRTSPSEAALNSINLLLNTHSGDSYTYSDLWVVLKEAGFSEIEFHQTEASTHIIIATKSIVG